MNDDGRSLDKRAVNIKPGFFFFFRLQIHFFFRRMVHFQKQLGKKKRKMIRMKNVGLSIYLSISSFWKKKHLHFYHDRIGL